MKLIYTGWRDWLTSELKTHIDRKLGDRKSYLMLTETTKELGMAILISEKINFKTEAITKDEVGHYVMIKGSI